MLAAIRRSILAVMQDAQPTSAPSTLLGPEDPAPFSVFHREGRAELVMFCDHAGRAFPKALSTLGLAPRELDQHIAWDIGIAGLGRRLAHSLDAPFFMTAYSRLVIDCNRHLDDPTSITQESRRATVCACPATAASARRIAGGGRRRSSGPITMR
jgi:predicted N-formylglutamate amidohydrolase